MTIVTQEHRERAFCHIYTNSSSVKVHELAVPSDGSPGNDEDVEALALSYAELDDKSLQRAAIAIRLDEIAELAASKGDKQIANMLRDLADEITNNGKARL